MFGSCFIEVDEGCVEEVRGSKAVLIGRHFFLKFFTEFCKSYFEVPNLVL